MELRPELMPPVLDEAKVARLAALASQIDGARPGQWEEELAEFNQLAGTEIPFWMFQGIYGGDGHEDWVRRVLYHEAIKPAVRVTREELLEVVRRAMAREAPPMMRAAYETVFDANVPLKDASNLIHYALDYDSATNKWGDGKPVSEYDPTPEQIVEWALTGERRTRTGHDPL